MFRDRTIGPSNLIHMTATLCLCMDTKISQVFAKRTCKYLFLYPLFTVKTLDLSG